MLVRHVRNSEGKGIATIVALSARRIGISICNKRDVFTKKLGILIASGRAATGSKPKMFELSKKGAVVAQAFAAMKIKARDHFKAKSKKK